MMKAAKPYSMLAQIYSHLMRSIDYKSWAKYLIDLFDSFQFEHPKILELGAGTGKISRYLEKKFTDIIYTDFSAEMLKRFEIPGSSLVCCSMTSLPFRDKFNIVFSIFDSVNYLTTTAKLRQLFNEAANILTHDGCLTFDVSLEKNSKKYQKYMNRKGKYNGIRYRQFSRYDESKKIHYNKFELELENGVKVHEIHKERIYPLETYYKTAKAEGLYVAACYDAFSFNKGDENSERVQLVIKKKDY